MRSESFRQSSQSGEDYGELWTSNVWFLANTSLTTGIGIELNICYPAKFALHLIKHLNLILPIVQFLVLLCRTEG